MFLHGPPKNWAKIFQFFMSAKKLSLDFSVLHVMSWDFSVLYVLSWDFSVLCKSLSGHSFVHRSNWGLILTVSIIHVQVHIFCSKILFSLLFLVNVPSLRNFDLTRRILRSFRTKKKLGGKTNENNLAIRKIEKTLHRSVGCVTLCAFHGGNAYLEINFWPHRDLNAGLIQKYQRLVMGH